MMNPHYEQDGITVICGDCRDLLREIPDASVQCCVTSPPYFGLRDYGVDGQIGLEPTVEAFVSEMVDVFAEVRRVLKGDGVMFLNLGDSYATSGTRQGNRGATLGNERLDEHRRFYVQRPNGLKEKDLIGIPWRVAFALQADGWYLRQDIIWAKPNPMPESVTDRCTKSHEYLFLLSKSPRYYYDAQAIREEFVAPNGMGWAKGVTTQDTMKTDGDFRRVVDRKGGGMVSMQPHEDGRNRRSVWTVATTPFAEAHFATFPPKLIEPCILAGSRPGDVVLDPFAGSGTTLAVAKRLERKAIGIELNPDYTPMIERRLQQGVLAMEVPA